MRIGPYEIVRELGRGGMGVVLLARAATGEEVALKVLKKNSGEAAARFERERRLLGGFTARDGFVPLLDAGTSPQGPWLVMPFLPGGTLRDKLEKGPLSADETVALGRAVARAVGLAHERGIVHRDLKPENVLFAADGKPLVADLGLAKHFTPEASGASQSVDLSRHDTARGTVGYMPLEQVTDAKSVGPSADVFALGAILYECLTGVPAFEGKNALEVISRLTEGPNEPLLVRQPSTPRWLAAVVESALAKDPAKRPEDALALLRALEGSKGGLLATSGRRALAAVVVVALVALVAVGAVAAVGARRGSATGVAAVGSSQDPSKPAYWTEHAAAHIELHDARGAIMDCDKALELDAEDATALYQRGVALTMTGELDRAKADFTKALARAPHHAPTWAAVGHVRLVGEDWDGALAAYDRALELDDKAPIAFMNRGIAKSHLEQREGALADFTRSIQLDPTPSSSWANRAIARLQLGDIEGALADCDEAIRRDPKNALAWKQRATALCQKSDWDGALVAYGRGFAIEKPTASDLAERALARSRIGDSKGALADCDQALALDARDATALGMRGFVRLSQHDYDGAIADLDRAIERDATNVTALMNRGYARAGKGDVKGAIEDLEQFLKQAPKNANAPVVKKYVAELRAREKP